MARVWWELGVGWLQKSTVASSGWLLGGAGPWPWNLERGQRPRCGDPSQGGPPCFGNLPVFNVGKRTGGGQVLPNGNIAAPPAPVEEFLNQDRGNLTKCDKFFLHGLLEMLAAVIVSVF